MIEQVLVVEVLTVDLLRRLIAIAHSETTPPVQGGIKQMKSAEVYVK